MPGHIESYVHSSEIGVLLQLKCKDDFTRRTEEFKNLARDLAMHIAASKPIAISASDLSAEIRNSELEYYNKAMENLNEKEKLDKIEKANKRINSTYCLLQQPFVKNPDVTVEEIIKEISGQLKDSISVVRFIRWDLK